jgi:endopolyphosphatase
VGDDLGGRMRAEEDGWGWEEEEDNENSSPMAAAAAAASPVEGGFSVQGKGNYLADLRSGWSKIPAPQTAKSEASRGGHHAAHWSERYSLALVNPSIVPNYLPTMRIYEYNISGLEDAPVWRDDPDKFSYGKAEDAEEGGEDDDGLVGGEDDDDAVIAEDAAPHQELKRGLDLDLDLDALGRRNKGKGRKNKSKDSKKPHRPHDPKLIIPAPPSKTAGPGPAYSPQPLSLTGYTQLFANLTRLNMPEEVVDGEDQNSVDDDADAAAGGKKKKQPQHLPFEFEVEYSTFADKWYRVPDLTVRSYVRLAYRIARRAGGQPLEAVDQEFDEEFALDFGNEDGDNDGGDDGKSDVESADKKKKKKGKKGKSRASNKLWLRFLSRAFIGAVPREDLKQWDD